MAKLSDACVARRRTGSRRADAPLVPKPRRGLTSGRGSGAGAIWWSFCPSRAIMDVSTNADSG